MMKNLILAVVASVLLLSACAPSDKKNTAKEIKYADPLSENIDSTVSPGKDFFLYSCGGWIKKNPIPSTEKGWGIWSLVQDETYNRMKSVSEECSKRISEKGSAEQKIGDFFFTGMDTVSAAKQGISPLNEELARIDSIHDKASLQQEIARLQTMGVDAVFGSYIFQDEKNSDSQALHLYQGGLGLPERDYYFKSDERTKKIREEYSKHITRMMMLVGQDSATAGKESSTILKFETALAKASRKLEDLRDPYKNYLKTSVDGMKSFTPSVVWKDLLADMHIHDVDSVIVGQPEFFKQVESAIKTTTLADWKTYLRWHLISDYAEYLSAPFEKESFAFRGTVLSGVKEQRPRWKRVLDEQESSIGDLLGKLYVERYVSPATKKRYQDLTNNIIEAYRERINQLTWMTDSTKAKALVKLNKITTKVAYPDKWKDYTKLEIDRTSYAANVMRANQWKHDYMVAKLGKPVDRTEWDMTPQTYNAYYNPSNNEIVLPAAIFIIPGLPDTLADDAIIYGYAGASTIGHEITHGFDDQGRQFDEQGNLKNWWSPQDEKEFKQRAEKIIKEFNNFKVLDSMHVNGEATQGENIADLGGVVLGLEAFKKTEQYKSGKMINGLTPIQRYFLGYALSWLGKYRDETIALRIMTDVHSPNFIRVNGPLMNIPEFYQAFNIKAGDPMFYPDSLRVHIW